jgi:hypothetical protein
MGDAVPLLLVILAQRLTRGGGQSHPRFADQLFTGLIHTNHRIDWIEGTRIDRQYVLQGGHKLGTVLGRNRPVFFPMRRQLVFFSVRRIVSYEIEETCSSSTNRSASRRNVHCAWPAGAGAAG